MALGIRTRRRGTALVREQRVLAAARPHPQVTRDLPEAGFVEASEVFERDVAPFDLPLPELADCAEGKLDAGPFAEDEPARERVTFREHEARGGFDRS